MPYIYGMASALLIEPADREFYEVIAQTAFCNPFSEQRSELDAKTVGHPIEVFSETHLDELRRVVSASVQKLESFGQADIRRYSAKDRDLMQTVFLFELFHCFHKNFDQLILEQVKLGVQSAPVKFAGEVLALMRRRGIGGAESL